MDDLQALVILNLVPGLGPVRLRALINEFGSPSAVLAAPSRLLARTAGVGSKLARELAAWSESDYDRELELIRRTACRVLPYTSAAFPPSLLETYDPPVLLYLLGDLLPCDRLAVAVVGSRRASPYGLSTARRLARGLAERGVTVVSGLALGIDAAAHAGALEGGGRTIAVLGSGLANLYPRQNRKLAAEVAASGAVVSEFPLRTPPLRENFPRRNRLVSGLSLGVVVVEAARRSGALITARLAAEQGRSVLAVPGRVDNPQAEGTNALIRDGAKMVTTADDVLEEFEYLVETRPTPSGGEKARASFSEAESAVLSSLAHGELPLDALIEKTGLTSTAISSILLGLELKRAIRRLPGSLYALY